MGDCAASDLCVAKTLPVLDRHTCPSCLLNVHAFCGELNEEASLKFHTTCFKCVAKYGRTFLTPEDFNTYMGSRKTSPTCAEAVGVGGVQETKEDIEDEEFMLETEDSTEEEKKSGQDDNANGNDDTLGTEESSPGVELLFMNDKDKEKQKIKEEKRRTWINEQTLDECIVGEEVNEFGVRTLETIAGSVASKWRNVELLQFCVNNKIKGYKNKSKAAMLELIAAKVLAIKLYGSKGRLGMVDDEEGEPSKKKSKTKSYKSSLFRPRSVTKSGSYFRIISLWFAPQNRHHALHTGQKMDRLELDVGGFRHQQTWEILAAQYNNTSEGPEFDYLNKLQVDNALYASENPADFDVLDARDVSQFVRWMNTQYYVIYKSASGNHLRFEDRVGEKAYLLYFHNMVTESGAENIETMMRAELNDGVFAQSMAPSMTITANTITAASRKRTSAAAKKDQTDQAFIKFMETMSSPSPSVFPFAGVEGSSDARDGYIDAKQRIAIKQAEAKKTLHAIEVGKEMSDAVDTHLKRWKESLKELRIVEQDFGTEHALTKATKATANMHEMHFNKALERATAATSQNETITVAPPTILFGAEV